MSKTINNYQIISKIASGGMSEVYLAQDIKTGKKVALKILDAKLSIDPEYLGRFKKEASICKQLDHENIVKIISYGTFNESYYIAYEYIEGITLDKYIKQQNLTVSQIESISVQILKALSYAHIKNIIHRDIKPSNIMIEGQTVKILDFGIAKQQLAATVTRSGLFMGSPHYVSPEQIEGHDIDNRSDIYSFGIVLYEMIQGTVPFSADTPWGIIRAHLDKKEPEITKDIPMYLKEVVSKCLAKKRQDRFKSADDIIPVILNKEEIGKGTIIIDRDKIKGDVEVKEKQRKKLSPVWITLIILLSGITLFFVIIGIMKNISPRQDYGETVAEEVSVSTTTEVKDSLATNNNDKIIESTTTSNNFIKTTEETIDYELMNSEYSFISSVFNLLNEYELAFNHMNVNHGEEWFFNDPNEIALEVTFLVKLEELSNKLENFYCPVSLVGSRNNLLKSSDDICIHKALQIESMRNNDWDNNVYYYDLFSKAVDSLYYNYNKMSDTYNNKYN